MTRNVWLVLALAAIGCGEGSSSTDGGDLDAGETSPSFDASTVDPQRILNEPPTGTITSPSEGQVIQLGDPISFAAVVGDAESPRETLSVQWLSNLSGLLHEATANEAGSTTFGSDNLMAGAHTVSLVVVDEGGLATEVTRSFVVNGPPEQAQVRLEPESPKTADDLQAIIAMDANDPNRASSELTYRYTWYRDDELMQTSSTVLSSQTAKGQLWRVEVRANDGMVDGLASSIEVTIGNTAPSCPAAVLLPAAGDTDETFTCSCPTRDDADDADADQDTCTFSNDGVWIADGCTLPADQTTKDMTLTCTITPSDGEDAGEPVTSAEVPVMNSLPTSPEVVLSPVEGTVNTLFTCEVVNDSTDLDGDTVTYQYTWYVNGYANPGTGSPTVLGGSLSRDVEGTPAGGGDQIFCRVVGDDNSGGLSNPSDSQVISLLNSPPSGGAVVISPPSATEADILTCVATEATDPDGQLVLWSYQWSVQGEDGVMAEVLGAVGEALTGADFNRGDVVSCTATPTDGISSGDPVESKNLVTITNSLPTLEGASLTPTLVDAYGEFTCAPYGWNDLDGDPEEVAYAWLVVDEDEQTLLPGKVAATLQAATLAPGEVVRCQVTPKNGQALGEAVQSADGEVMNDPPSLESATLTPGEPTVDATLICAPSGYSDLEGGGPNYLYTWKRNNEDIIGATNSTLSEGFAKGDVVRCVITPNDGIDDGDAVPSNEVTILNTLPAIGSVSVTPDFAAPCETLSCEVADVTEPDEADILTYAYRWELNGGPIAPVTKSLSAAAYAPNDTLRCYVKPTDGSFKQLPNGGVTTVWGDEVQSNIATVINTPPTLASVSIGPTEPQVGDILTCAPEGFEDADCSPPALFHYIWYVNGEIIDDADGPTLSLDFVTAGAKLQCQTIPDDGYTQGSGKLSAVVTVTNAPPTDAVVTVDAPDGSAGDVTCAFQVEPTDSDPLTYTWFWQLNDQTEVVGEQTLPAGSTTDCDLVQCRVEVSDGLATTSSNVASLNLPVGPACEDDNLCTSHGCLPEGGCATTPNTAPCDDGDPCTTNDACLEGTCAGQPDDCDDDNLCTIDSCHPTTGCTHSYDPGVCNDQNPCTSDLCDLASGSCVNTTLDDGTLCDGDDDGCTQADSCFAGTCIVGAAVDCPGEPDVCQHQVCESLSPQAYICKTVYSPDTVNCEDGLQCTTADHCNGSGTCVPGSYLDCSAGAGPCQLGACVEGEGCTFTDAPDGNACNSDNNGCTTDTCSDGLCLPGSTVDCSLEGGPCKLGFCESSGPSTYQCTFVPTLLGTPCDTGDFCYVNAACDGEGECDGGTLRDCEAEVGSVCHTGYCDSQSEVCIPTKAADGSGCDDGSTCTVTDSCVNGYCQGSGDACREERLSVALSGASKPDVADLGYGRYVVQYAGSEDEVGGRVYDYIRLNDPYGSREDEEHDVAGDVLMNSNQTVTQFTTPTAVAPNGSFLTTSWTGNGCSCSGLNGCSCEAGELVVRAFDYLGDQIAENLTLESHLLQVDGSPAEGNMAMTESDLDTLAFADGSWGIFKLQTFASSGVGAVSGTANEGLTYTPLSHTLVSGTPVELIERAEFSQKRLFDVVTIPNTTDFFVVWVHALYKLGQPRWDQLYIQRFSTLGIALTTPALIYENTTPDAHKTEALEARYIDATGEVLIVWDDLHPSVSEGLRRVRWLWSSLEGEMVGTSTYAAYDEGLGNQRLADVDVFSDGGFVVTWDDDAGDVDGFSAKARVFEVDGSPTSDQLALNRIGVGDQTLPGVAVLAGDEWVTAFASDSGEVWTRRYNREGVDAVGQLERHANATTSGIQLELSGKQTEGGDVFLAWTSPYAGNSGSEIVGRRIDHTGASITAEAQVNTTMSGAQSHPSVAAFDQGWFVAWQSASSGALGMEVTGRLVDATGTPTGAEITIPSQTSGNQTRPMIASQGDSAMAVWESDAVTPGSSSDIHGRMLSASGEGLGDEFLISSGALSYRPAIAAIPDGSGYVVAWETKEGPDWDVLIRHFDQEGVPQSDGVIAHQSTQLDQGRAAVAVGPGGYLIVCVETTTNYGATAIDVSCQRITTSGLEFIGPELTPYGVGSNQAHPAVDYLADGSWVVAWDSEDLDGDQSGVQLRRYSAFGVPMGQRIVANRTWEGSQSHPMLLPIAGPLNSVIVGWRDSDEADTDVMYRVLPGL
ncbi:MAG: hypothetical protein ACPGU1_12200 [Myxococcota bacterium]